jgi:glycosyltransferase involved in cell wall biosynthesis
MIVVEFTPDAKLTGILRFTMQVIRALSLKSDVYLLMGLQFPNYDVPRRCQVKLIKKGATSSSFDEDILAEIASLPIIEVPRNEIENMTIFYPRWRPMRKYFAKEIGVVFDCSPVMRSNDFVDPNSRYFLQFLKTSRKFNDLTIAISDFTLQEVQSLVPFSSDKLKRIYPGPSFSPKELRRTASTNSSARRKNRYCIFVGSLDPRKGIVEMLTWWNANRLTLGYSKLIVVGSIPTWAPIQHQASVKALLQQSHDVFHVGAVHDAKVFDLLTKSSLLLYPSRYEGFGLPVCDALFAGIKVLTSNQTSTKEFKKAGAILIDPEKPWEWNAALEDFSSTPLALEKLSSTFNWENYANEIVSL